MHAWPNAAVTQAAFAAHPLALFVASNIWGHGPVGYGRSRVARIIATEGKQLESKLAGSREAHE